LLDNILSLVWRNLIIRDHLLLLSLELSSVEDLLWPINNLWLLEDLHLILGIIWLLNLWLQLILLLLRNWLHSETIYVCSLLRVAHLLLLLPLKWCVLVILLLLLLKDNVLEMRGWSLEILAIVLLGLSVKLVKFLLIDWRDRSLLLLRNDRIGILRSLLLL